MIQSSCTEVLLPSSKKLSLYSSIGVGCCDTNALSEFCVSLR